MSKKTQSEATIQIVSADKDTIVKTGERFLNVQAVITDGKKKLPRNYAFALGTNPKEIEKALKKALDLYVDEKAHAEANAETSKAEATADKTIEALQGTTINS